jgi:hypothetical protein
MDLKNKTRFYRKPEAICRYDQKWEEITSPEDVSRFLESQKIEIEKSISELGLSLRLGTVEDLDDIDRLHHDCYPPDTVTLEDPYVLFRIVNYGYCVTVRNPKGRMVGCHLGIDFNNQEKTSYGIRGTVHEDYRGSKLGALIAIYSALLAMERKAAVRRALVSPMNYAALFNNLNHMGHMCDGFYTRLKGFGIRLTICLPLTPGGIKNNRIDLDKTESFIKSHKPGHDYLLISPEDTNEIDRLYRETPFRVAAVLKEGYSGGHLLALPNDRLGIP